MGDGFPVARFVCGPQTVAELARYDVVDLAPGLGNGLLLGLVQA